jgi:hypothetical protein
VPDRSSLQIYAAEADSYRRDTSDVRLRADHRAVRSFSDIADVRRVVSADCQWRDGALPQPRRQLHLYDVLIAGPSDGI